MPLIGKFASVPAVFASSKAFSFVSTNFLDLLDRFFGYIAVVRYFLALPFFTVHEINLNFVLIKDYLPLKKGLAIS